MNSRIKSFEPIVDKDSEILILGSMPGVESLRKQQYYAFNRNQFWKILFTIFNCREEADYCKKKLFLKKQKIALWDVYKYCDRKGSLDSNIKNEIINDFTVFFTKYPNIRTVLCNGGKAYKGFTGNVSVADLNISCFLLPSTSPANTMKFSDKFLKWKSIIMEM